MIISLAAWPTFDQPSCILKILGVPDAPTHPISISLRQGIKKTTSMKIQATQSQSISLTQKHRDIVHHASRLLE